MEEHDVQLNNARVANTTLMRANIELQHQIDRLKEKTYNLEEKVEGLVRYLGGSFCINDTQAGKYYVKPISLPTAEQD